MTSTEPTDTATSNKKKSETTQTIDADANGNDTSEAQNTTNKNVNNSSEEKSSENQANSNSNSNNNNAAAAVDDTSDNGKKPKAIQPGRWLALESNPVSANKFAIRMGLPNSISFGDIYGLDAELLAFVPQPVLAVMLLFPSSPAIREFKSKQAEELTANPQKIDKDLFYLYQHNEIGNACGTVAMIHAISSLTHPKSIMPIKLNDGPLTKFLADTRQMDWTKRGWHLLSSLDIQEASEDSANDNNNQTASPAREAKVNAHFISFVCVSKCIYEMDGRKKFPINHGETTAETFLSDVAKIVKQNFMNVDPNNVNFNLMALSFAQ